MTQHLAPRVPRGAQKFQLNYYAEDQSLGLAANATIKVTLDCHHITLIYVFILQIDPGRDNIQPKSRKASDDQDVQCKLTGI